MTAAALRKAGLVVLEAKTGEDALDWLISPPDVLFTDIRLPGQSGSILSGITSHLQLNGPLEKEVKRPSVLQAPCVDSGLCGAICGRDGPAAKRRLSITHQLDARNGGRTPCMEPDSSQ